MTTLHILITIYFCANCLCTDIEDYNKGSYKFFFLSIFFLWIIIPSALIYKFFEEFITPEIKFYFDLWFRYKTKFGDLTEKQLGNILKIAEKENKGRFKRHAKALEKKWLRKNT